jgi:hypothetical protein
MLAELRRRFDDLRSADVGPLQLQDLLERLRVGRLCDVGGEDPAG